jgi:hypothetical protein
MRAWTAETSSWPGARSRNSATVVSNVSQKSAFTAAWSAWLTFESTLRNL